MEEFFHFFFVELCNAGERVSAITMEYSWMHGGYSSRLGWSS